MRQFLWFAMAMSTLGTGCSGDMKVLVDDVISHVAHELIGDALGTPEDAPADAKAVANPQGNQDLKPMDPAQL